MCRCDSDTNIYFFLLFCTLWKSALQKCWYKWFIRRMKSKMVLAFFCLLSGVAIFFEQATKNINFKTWPIKLESTHFSEHRKVPSKWKMNMNYLDTSFYFNLSFYLLFFLFLLYLSFFFLICLHKFVYTFFMFIT